MLGPPDMPLSVAQPSVAAGVVPKYTRQLARNLVWATSNAEPPPASGRTFGGPSSRVSAGSGVAAAAGIPAAAALQPTISDAVSRTDDKRTHRMTSHLSAREPPVRCPDKKSV